MCLEEAIENPDRRTCTQKMLEPKTQSTMVPVKEMMYRNNIYAAGSNWSLEVVSRTLGLWGMWEPKRQSSIKSTCSVTWQIREVVALIFHVTADSMPSSSSHFLTSWLISASADSLHFFSHSSLKPQRQNWCYLNSTEKKECCQSMDNITLSLSQPEALDLHLCNHSFKQSLSYVVV